MSLTDVPSLKHRGLPTTKKVKKVKQKLTTKLPTTLDQVNRFHQAKATDLSRKKDHSNSRISTSVTIDTGSGINITHDKSLLIDYKAFKSPLTTYFNFGPEELQIPIKLIGQG